MFSNELVLMQVDLFIVLGRSLFRATEGTWLNYPMKHEILVGFKFSNMSRCV